MSQKKHTQSKVCPELVIITYGPNGGWTLATKSNTEKHLTPLEAVPQDEHKRRELRVEASKLAGY